MSSCYKQWTSAAEVVLLIYFNQNCLKPCLPIHVNTESKFLSTFTSIDGLV